MSFVVVIHTLFNVVLFIPFRCFSIALSTPGDLRIYFRLLLNQICSYSLKSWENTLANSVIVELGKGMCMRWLYKSTFQVLFVNCDLDIFI